VGPLSRQSGISLIELMVGMTLSLVLLVSIGYLFAGSRQSYRSQEQSARMQETGRFALDVIAYSLRQAGTPEVAVAPPSNLKLAFAGVPLTGTDGGAGVPDTITVEYDAVYESGATGYTERDCEGQSFSQSGARVRNAFTLDNDPNDADGRIELECAGQVIAADGTVKKGGSKPVAVPFVTDVEDLQFSYGIDTNSDGSVDQYVDLPADFGYDFGQAVAVRACVVVRSETGVGALNQPYIGCDGQRVIPNANDTRVRRAFVETIVLRTRAGG
jgi:type IV pilus assembly protein PilW